MKIVQWKRMPDVFIFRYFVLVEGKIVVDPGFPVNKKDGILYFLKKLNQIYKLQKISLFYMFDFDICELN